MKERSSPHALLVALDRAGLGDAAREIAKEHGVGVVDVLSAARYRHVVRARKALMLNLRIRGYSHPEIGRLVGRDHTTVIASVRPHLLNAPIVEERVLPSSLLPEIPDLDV